MKHGREGMKETKKEGRREGNRRKRKKNFFFPSLPTFLSFSAASFLRGQTCRPRSYQPLHPSDQRQKKCFPGWSLLSLWSLSGASGKSWGGRFTGGPNSAGRGFRWTSASWPGGFLFSGAPPVGFPALCIFPSTSR